ncbi:MAG: hypothetical protein U1E23_02030 [Reyranellaceae bacterium]
MTFVAALFAITLNFLQPLAHAAVMRTGDPQAMASLWGAFCVANGAEGEAQDAATFAGKIHDCCLGLAHAPALAEAPTAYALIGQSAAVVRCPAPSDAVETVGIRDGPGQPRAPPLLV